MSTNRYLKLSGLEPLVVRPDVNFVNIGERTNVTGSKLFLRLIQAGNFSEALSISRDQVEGVAQILDVNMDEGMLDGKTAMITFLNMLASEPDIARIPLMIDSSKWEILEAGLQVVQDKCGEFISLKKEKFSSTSPTNQKNGAAIVVMAFDENGQAHTLERRMKSINAPTISCFSKHFHRKILFLIPTSFQLLPVWKTPAQYFDFLLPNGYGNICPMSTFRELAMYHFPFGKFRGTEAVVAFYTTPFAME